MRPIVRDLYKRLLLVGREYPAGLDHVRQRAKRDFRKNSHVTDDVAIKRCVAYGRYMVREMEGVIALKKYRTLRQRYNPDEK